MSEKDTGGYCITFAGSENVTISSPHIAQHMIEYWDDQEGAAVRIVGRSDGTVTRTILRDE